MWIPGVCFIFEPSSTYYSTSECSGEHFHMLFICSYADPGNSRHHRVPSSSHQRNAIEMAFCWWADDGPLRVLVQAHSRLCKIWWLKQKSKLLDLFRDAPAVSWLQRSDAVSTLRTRSYMTTPIQTNFQMKISKKWLPKHMIFCTPWIRNYRKKCVCVRNHLRRLQFTNY